MNPQSSGKFNSNTGGSDPSQGERWNVGRKVARLLIKAVLIGMLPLVLQDCCSMKGNGRCTKGDRMIVDKLDRAEKYFGQHPAFQKAFAFLRADSLNKLPPGRHGIDGDRLYCMISEGPGKKRTEARLEAHRKYIDIQYILEGTDEMGWKPAASCGIPDGDYVENRDVIFYRDKPRKWAKVPAGSFAIFFPRDAHAPMVSDGQIRKAVVKVAVE
jgi:biofilm protein TabA